MNTESVLEQAKKIIHSNDERDTVLLKICKLLDEEVDAFDWTGFYLVSDQKEKMLELGPYVGEETDHTEIPFGKGICGQAAETLDTFVVQDVSEAENYLACSIHVKSEIVVPIMKNNKFVGELDIDSHKRNAISPELIKLCENICSELTFLF